MGNGETGEFGGAVSAPDIADDSTRDVFVHIGFHQETAARYAHRVSAAIDRLRRDHPDAPIVFETLEASVARARGVSGASSAD